MTQSMARKYQLRLLKQLCYIPGPDSWWITFGITASRGDWISAASAVIDLPRCKRQISEAGFHSLPQQENSVYLDNLCITGKRRDHQILACVNACRSWHPCKNVVSKIGFQPEFLCLPNSSHHWGIKHRYNSDCNVPLDGRCVNKLFTTVLSWCQICLRL